MGVHHSAYRVGCCWALMGLLFFVGVMNLLWVAAIIVFVLIEKIALGGYLFARAQVTRLGYHFPVTRKPHPRIEAQDAR